MFEFTPGVGWLLLAYASGTLFTLFLLLPQVYEKSIGDTIDSLIDKGFLRHKRNSDGEIEILKWNDNQNT
jgi:hypothetical protein